MKNLTVGEDKKLNTYRQLNNAGYETTPEPPYTGRKIIPFHVMRHTETEIPPLIDFQTRLEVFLQKMGYIE